MAETLQQRRESHRLQKVDHALRCLSLSNVPDGGMNGCGLMGRPPE
ncbi:hypothetical protein [Agrobacterium cavarae]|nr:hypothetical protein [Agrobacterium cavarae]